MLPLPHCRQVTDDLKAFLTTNLPKVKKDKAKFKLGVSEPKLGSAIQVRGGGTGGWGL